MPCKRVSLSIGVPLVKMRGEGGFACRDFLRKKDSISRFLSWTQRLLRFYVWGPSGTLLKGQGCAELIDYGAQRAISSRCIRTIRV